MGIRLWHGILEIVGLCILLVVIDVIQLRLQNVNQFKDLLVCKVRK